MPHNSPQQTDFVYSTPYLQAKQMDLLSCSLNAIFARWNLRVNADNMTTIKDCIIRDEDIEEKVVSRHNVNPWETIPLSDYENHMSLDSVMQLQVMNRIMKRQFCLCAAKSAMMLGVAGGNGLEHAATCEFERVYGVDINREYLQRCRERYPDLNGILECICADLTNPNASLPHADLLIANLLIEYIGYDCFCRTVARVRPQFVSCIIQINTDDSFVSDSPYLHVFDGLESVHHQMSERELAAAMQAVGYRLSGTSEEPLPNGKSLVQMDFAL